MVTCSGSSLVKSRGLVSHGYVLRSWFVKGDECSSSQIDRKGERKKVKVNLKRKKEKCENVK